LPDLVLGKSDEEDLLMSTTASCSGRSNELRLTSPNEILPLAATDVRPAMHVREDEMQDDEACVIVAGELHIREPLDDDTIAGPGL
jgi:hypothetical protein